MAKIEDYPINYVRTNTSCFINVFEKTIYKMGYFLLKV